MFAPNRFSATLVRCVLACCWLVLAVVTTASAAPVLIYGSFNRSGVDNNPPIYPVFTISRTWTIFQVDDYHWNYGQGQDPFTIGGAIAIYNTNSGALVGSWAVTATTAGQGGVPNAVWYAYPGVNLGPGSYKIVDSDPATWAYSIYQSYLPEPDWKPYQGFSEVWATPEPSSWLLLASGLLGVIGVTRRKFMA